MKIYKIYAQCARSAKPIKEITENEAQKLITGAVDQMVDNGDIDITGETDEEISREFDEWYIKAYNFYHENGYFDCGDFRVEKTDEPVRDTMYGYTGL